MLGCGLAGPKVCVVSVITDGKLPVKYGSLRNRSEGSKIVFLSFPIIFTVIVFIFLIIVFIFTGSCLGLKIGKKT